MDEKQMVSVWISDFLFPHVLSDAGNYGAGLSRCTGSASGRHTAVDIQASLALGLPWQFLPCMGRTVCFRILQRNADFNGIGTGHHGSV